jgi:DNA-binding winged helix-turn-helix (wHTH) protein
VTTTSRFVFGEFVVSPRQRLLLRHGQPVPLIPRYFDLLLLLIARRREAVSKDAIFTEVWSDVVVSDGALSQAIRTLRRTLGDDAREPRFIRTVSRHGYQFVHTEVVEQPDEGAAAHSAAAAPDLAAASVAPLVEQLMTTTDPEEARDLAEQLHTAGTADALAQLTARPHHATAVAIMRDARWNVPNAGDVPMLSDAEAPRAILALIRLRLNDVKGAVARRWATTAIAGIFGGVAAALLGGLALATASASSAPGAAVVALAAIGAAAGGIGAAGIGAGLAAAEVLARSRRTVALIAAGGTGGALVAALAVLILQALLRELFGLDHIDGGSGWDGLLVGAAAGLGYGLTTQPSGGGMAAPRGTKRVLSAAAISVCCAAATTALALAGHPLVGGLIHEVARSSEHSDLVLAPLGRLIGEPDFGPVTRVVLSAFEGSMFGAALGIGLTHRPATGRNR